MQVPRGLDASRPLHVVIFIVMVAGLVVVAVGRCSRAMNPRPPSTTYQSAPLQPIVDVGSVSIGSVVQGTLGVDQRQGWTLAATKGQRIAVGLYSAWDNSVSVTMPDSGRELTEDGFSGGNGQGLITGVTLPVDGTYLIVVRGEKGGAGNYELAVTEAPPSKPGTITTVGPGDAPILITR
ncbi:hypothetical protein [Devosia sp. SL43]|uniref:hypothetical protein n=1 Tax=Devosia sp. SL43 TaxID=2806348 RepID=UPI001F2227D4|nr:hypothetical protein [Devosia sp. SL43]UJW85792.1 hypothetical protein IM737_00345 [Devosia sp. SL43]